MTSRTRTRPRRRAPGDLTPRQARFVDEYLVDSNATQAAIRAGCKAQSAATSSNRWLRNAKVAAEIRRRRAALSKRTEITAQRVLDEYAKVAFARMSDYVMFGAGGVQLQESATIEPDKLDAIAEVRATLGGVSFKLHNKLDALQALGKHLGLFVERHEHEIGQRMSGMLDTIKARLSPEAQEELIRAVGVVLAEDVAPAADDDAQASR